MEKIGESMSSGFIPMIFAVLKENGIDTKDMEVQDAIKKYEELTGKDTKSKGEDKPYTKTGIHYGDLNIAKKAETSYEQGKYRGTGHFGTGFYMLGTDDTTDKNYTQRGRWEIDMSQYKMYKPDTDYSGRHLHDNLRVLDGTDGKMLNMNSEQVRYQVDSELEKTPMPDFMDKIRSKVETELENEMGGNFSIATLVNYEKKFDKRLNEEINNYKPTQREQNELNERFDKLTKLSKDLFNTSTQRDKDVSIYEVNDYTRKLYQTIDDIGEEKKEYEDAVRNLYNAPGIRDKNMSYTKFKSLCDNAVKGKSDDSKATRLMKSLGWDGIDVTGINGLDNFEYGSVIYDLKPNTYRQTKK